MQDLSRVIVQDLRICRVCLATQIKLFDLYKLGSAESYSELSQIPLSRTDHLPHYICFFCNALLYKALRFKSKCQDAYKFLQKEIKDDLITTDELHDIGKSKFSMTLSIAETETSEYVPRKELGNIPHDHDVDEKGPPCSDINNLYIKSEPDHDYYNINGSQPLEIKKEKESMKRKPESKKVEKRTTKNRYNEKFEEDFVAFSSASTTEPDDDYDIPITIDEGLQPLAIKKEKETKKRKPKRKKIEKRATKNRYNEKFEEDFVAFSSAYNVDVKFLSKEEQLELIVQRKETSGSKESSYRFNCDKCYKRFQTENAYKRHSLIHDPARGSHVCDVCQNRFSTKIQLLRHRRMHKIQFVCKICHHVNKSSTAAKLHHKWHLGSKFECPYCQKKFNAQSTKLNHVRENHTSVQCGACGESVSGTLELSRHTVRTHGDKQEIKCPKCDTHFHTKMAFARHESAACDVIAHHCSVCGESFGNAELLVQHGVETHRDGGYKCSQCPATFSTDRSLGIHWSRSHSNRCLAHSTGSYICEFCAKIFTSATRLKNHLTVHTGEKPYKCSFCPKMFRLHGQLKVHTNTHTGEKPFKCNLCSAFFTSYTQKHKHKLLVHTKERPYKCTMCDKTYVLSCDLKMHTRFTHMNVPRPPRVRKKTVPK